jgi:hypothetical protein
MVEVNDQGRRVYIRRWWWRRGGKNTISSKFLLSCKLTYSAVKVNFSSRYVASLFVLARKVSFHCTAPHLTAVVMQDKHSFQLSGRSHSSHLLRCDRVTSALLTSRPLRRIDEPFERFETSLKGLAVEHRARINCSFDGRRPTELNH